MRTKQKVILASASPRRRELLTLVGIEHDVNPADVDESILAMESPAAHVERLARSKAAVVAAREPHALVVGADTIVVIDDEILGKPRDEQSARSTLARLSGRTHTVFTGVACALNGKVEAAVEQVAVTFRDLSEAEIERYVATGEPMDKAGSYGIQGFGATIVRRIEGDYFAVMGLSLVRMVELFKRLGVNYQFGSI